MVFSGENKPPLTYSFKGANNVAGVLGHKHSLEFIHLLLSLVPKVRRFVAVLDKAPLWPFLQARMKARVARVPDVEFIAWDSIWTSTSTSVGCSDTRHAPTPSP